MHGQGELFPVHNVHGISPVQYSHELPTIPVTGILLHTCSHLVLSCSCYGVQALCEPVELAQLPRRQAWGHSGSQGGTEPAPVQVVPDSRQMRAQLLQQVWRGQGAHLHSCKCERCTRSVLGTLSGHQPAHILYMAGRGCDSPARDDACPGWPSQRGMIHL